MTTSTLERLLAKLNRETGLPVYITEYEIDTEDDDRQLEIYQSQFPVFWQAEYVRGITVWGWIHRPVWAAHSYLVKDGTPRPAMTWLMGFLGRPVPQ